MSIKTYFKQLFRKLQPLDEEPDKDDTIVEKDSIEAVVTLQEAEKEPAMVLELVLDEPNIARVKEMLDQKRKTRKKRRVVALSVGEVNTDDRKRNLPTSKRLLKIKEKRGQWDSSAFDSERFTAASTMRDLCRAGACNGRVIFNLSQLKIITVREFLIFYSAHKHELMTMADIGAVCAADITALYKKLSPHFRKADIVIDFEYVESDLNAYSEACGHLNEVEKFAIEAYCIYFFQIKSSLCSDYSSVYQNLSKFLFTLPVLVKKSYAATTLSPLYKQLRQILHFYRESNYQTKVLMNELSKFLPEKAYQTLSYKVDLKSFLQSMGPARYMLFQLRYEAFCKGKVKRRENECFFGYRFDMTEVLDSILSVSNFDIRPSLWRADERYRIYIPTTIVEMVETEIARIASCPLSVVFCEMLQMKWGYHEITPFVHPYYLCHDGLPMFFLTQQLSDRASVMTEMLNNRSLWSSYDELLGGSFLFSDSTEIEQIRTREFVSLPNEAIIRTLAYAKRDTVCLFVCLFVWARRGF